MKLISFDIGIRNLAFTIIEQLPTTENTDKKILHWNIINLIKDPEHCYITTCKKPVIKSCIYMDDNTIFMCEKHLPYYDTLKSTNNPLSELSNVKHINCLNVDIDDLRMAIITKLDSIVLPLINSEQVEAVALENQPSMKNPRMKAVADCIYMWFLLRCKVDAKIVKTINYISPSNKLKKYAEELIGETEKEVYNATKDKAIVVVTEYLKNSGETVWLEYFNTFKKQDDLADCLLQGFYYLDNVKDIADKATKKANKKKTKKATKKTKTDVEPPITETVEVSEDPKKRKKKTKMVKEIID
jgi:hypothetical protein